MSASTIEPQVEEREDPEEVVAVEKHPRAIRWMHWVNFPLLTLMIYSGLRIYWAEDVYRIGLGDTTLFAFFPEAFYTLLQLDFNLANGMAWHFFFGWFFVINGALYLTFTVVTGEWRELVPERGSLRRAWHTLLHDLHLRDEEPPRRGLYNDAQRLTYTGVVVMGIGSVLTGFAIYKPTQLWWLVEVFGGYQPARAIHFALTIGFVLFFVVHIAQVVRAGWGNFWSMVSGYEKVPAGEVGATVGTGELEEDDR